MLNEEMQATNEELQATVDWWKHEARSDVGGQAYSVSTQPLHPADKRDALVILRESS